MDLEKHGLCLRPAAAGLAVALALVAFAAEPPAGPAPAAPAALAPAPAAPAATAAAEFKPFVFIHAGDPEIGSPDLPGTVQRFAMLAKRATDAGAALVAVSGDITRHGSDEELQATRDALRRFTVPVLLVPGNHDEPEVFRKNFGEDHRVFTHNNCDFVCANSNLLDEPPASGSPEAKAQWKWLEDALAASRRAGRTHVFLVMHHPEAGGKALAALLEKHGVVAVLCGHLHTTEESRGKGFVTYVTPGTAKFRDTQGLGYRVFKVAKDRIEQAFVPLEKDVAAKPAG
ncbi:MAG: metallophosphoesterase [Planctomycetota bacterium]|nr:metallophosphoesterase [Planctomycetota bacterium]